VDDIGSQDGSYNKLALGGGGAKVKIPMLIFTNSREY